MGRLTLHAPLAGAVLAAVALGLAWPAHGAWLALPLALALAAAEPTARRGLTGAALTLVAATAAARGLAPVAVLVAPACLGVLLVVRTRLERERDAMRRTALRDPLTGLANRRAIDERLRYEINRHTRARQVFTVLVLDLDGFKPVNDRFGHEAGDELLRDVAGALLGALRAQDTVARLGGDEFCVLAPATDRAGAAQLAHRIDVALAGATAGVHGVTASIGAALFPVDARTPEGLIGAADADVLEAKRRFYAGRSRRRAA